jgi:hypothetical protein
MFDGADAGPFRTVFARKPGFLTIFRCGSPPTMSEKDGRMPNAAAIEVAASSLICGIVAEPIHVSAKNQNRVTITAFVRSNPVDFTGQSKHRYAPWLNRNENLCIVILVCLSLALR